MRGIEGIIFNYLVISAGLMPCNYNSQGGAYQVVIFDGHVHSSIRMKGL